jgi:predicted enzyme related to lactoylglutathione lyase
MSKVVHFEIPTTNPEKSCDFYSKVFGWKFSKWGEMPYWLAESGPKDEPGIWGAITMKSGNNMNVVNTLSVENVDKAMEDVKVNGGEVITEKMTIPTIGWMFYFKDPDGNIHGAMQSNPDAK